MHDFAHCSLSGTPWFRQVHILCYQKSSLSSPTIRPARNHAALYGQSRTPMRSRRHYLHEPNCAVITYAEENVVRPTFRIGVIWWTPGLRPINASSKIILFIQTDPNLPTQFERGLTIVRNNVRGTRAT
jgi:hypothetical protein